MPTFLHHHLHHGHPNEFQQILRARNLHALAFSVARVFIPLFLINIYGGLAQALWPITVFMLGGYALRLLLMPQFAAVIVRLGAKHAMAMSFVLAVVSLVMTAFLQSNLIYIFVLAFFLGAGNALFFMSYHVDLALTLNKSDALKHGIGSVEMLRKVALALGPLAGGLIATQISEKALFIVAAIIMSMAASALYLKEDNVISHKTKLQLWKAKTYRKYRRYFIANFAMGINSCASSFLWSILLFVVIGTYQAVGFVLAVSLILSLGVIAYARRRDSLRSDKLEINGGSTATSLLHVARPFVETGAMATGINFFNDIAFSFLYVPYVDQYYKQVCKKDGLTFVALMESSVLVGYLIPWFAFVGLFLAFGQNLAFIGAYVLAAIATLFVPLISRKA